jgi:hypothetical protein
MVDHSLGMAPVILVLASCLQYTIAECLGGNPHTSTLMWSCRNDKHIQS